MNNEFIELIEVFVPTDEPGNIFRGDGQAYKSIAVIANGEIIRLEEDYGIQKHIVSKEQLERIKTAGKIGKTVNNSEANK